MNTDLIIIKEYCLQSRIEPDFIVQLVNEGLLEITVIDNEDYINSSQLSELEQYARWYYDLSINVAGIDVVHNLLDRMNEMRIEMTRLREQLRLLD